jgi:hypothetical protein
MNERSRQTLISQHPHFSLPAFVLLFTPTEIAKAISPLFAYSGFHWGSCHVVFIN